MYVGMCLHTCVYTGVCVCICVIISICVCVCVCCCVLHLSVKGVSDTQHKSPGTQESPLGRGAGGERVQESSCRRRLESFGARKAEFEQERGMSGPRRRQVWS